MKDELVGFEVAKLAKEKGFDELTDYNYSSTGNLISGTGRWRNSDWAVNISAPTQSLLQRWIREVYKIDISIEPVWNNAKKLKSLYSPWVYYRANEEPGDEKQTYFDSYEQALEEALIEALKLIK